MQDNHDSSLDEEDVALCMMQCHHDIGCQEVCIQDYNRTIETTDDYVNDYNIDCVRLFASILILMFIWYSINLN